ncbi:MAG: hypothetical protein H6738_00435 [Alphaproteobacteria bacterium]|nr:hypothetical protein [Alphaproteobacteria bacterium]MCB9695234.1 hypothetical protein [Alphaproteobacteria bacterium]
MSLFATVLGVVMAACPIVAAMAVVAVVIFLINSSVRRRREALASELGLVREGRQLVGEIDGLSVRTYTVSRGGKNKKTYAIVEVDLPGMPPDLAVVGRLGKGAKQDIDVGDRLFDHAYRIDASGLGLAWLSEDARHTLRRHGLALRGGQVISDVRGDVSAAQIQVAVEGARALRVDDPVAKLQEISERDPSPRMRARAIDALLDQPGGTTDELLGRWVTQDGLPGILASVHRGHPFDRRLREIEDIDRHLLGEHLSRHGPPERIVELIDALTPSTPRPVWYMATEAAANHGSEAVRAAVVRALGRFGDAAFFADRAVRALVAGGPEVEGTLVELLPRLDQGLPEALTWLEEHGEVGSVSALDRMLEGSWPMSDTRERAQRAKRAIQGRAAGVRGGLALAADGAAGALSEAQSAAGRVSVAQKAGS